MWYTFYSWKFYFDLFFKTYVWKISLFFPEAITIFFTKAGLGSLDVRVQEGQLNEVVLYNTFPLYLYLQELATFTVSVQLYKLSPILMASSFYCLSIVILFYSLGKCCGHNTVTYLYFVFLSNNYINLICIFSFYFKCGIKAN